MDKDINKLANDKDFSDPIDRLVAHIKRYSRDIHGEELSTAEAVKIAIKLVQVRNN